MKKLRLSFVDSDNMEVLSREQLKTIMGGDGSGYGNAVLCGTRSENGQCYCDFCDNVTYFPIYCDVPCDFYPCRLP